MLRLRRCGFAAEEIELLAPHRQCERQEARQVADAQERGLRGGFVLEVLKKHKLVPGPACLIEGDEVYAGGGDEARELVACELELPRHRRR